MTCSPVRRSLVWLLAILPASSACTSLAAPPKRFEAAECVTDPSLAGTWTDARMTQMGPGWMRFTFACDCTYSARVQLLFARITDRGQYRASDGRIRFERSSGGQTVWPYRIDAAGLTLSESANEEHRYRRRGGAATCQVGT